MNYIVGLAFTRKTLELTRKTLQLKFLNDSFLEKEAFLDQNVPLKAYPHLPLYNILLPKSQKDLICSSKVIDDLEAPEDLH